MLIYKRDSRYINFCVFIGLVMAYFYYYQDVRIGNCQYTKVRVHNARAKTFLLNGDRVWDDGKGIGFSFCVNTQQDV